MAKSLALIILTVLTSLIFVEGNNKSIVNDTDSIKISLLPESESPLIVSDKDKSILRYGFHRIHDCQNFDKAFICIRKCLDLNYQIAHSDKNCICTCYKNNILAKYKAPIGTASTKWKLGAPSTVRPSWAGGVAEKKPHDYEINANYTEFIGVDKASGDAAENPVEDDGITPGEDDHTGDGEGSGEVAPDADGVTPGDAEAAPGEEAGPAEEEAPPEK